MADWKENELISLNLIYSYPVKWSRYKVLRDFIQNFYDAVGSEHWYERAFTRYEKGRLTMSIKGVAFSHEWLIHIGASTKRGAGKGKNAGYFGEGFKIATLCAQRDHDWSMTMAAGTWEIKGTTTDLVIDDTSLTSLAYRKRKRHDDGLAVLTLEPFSEEDMEIFETARLSFYYPENPLLGKEIWRSDQTAVYWRSKVEKPYLYPSTHEMEGKGILFAGRQALGSFPYPLVFCKHDFTFNDRERNTFYRMDVVKILKKIAPKLPSQAAAVVLRALRSRWYDRPKARYDFDTWYPIIQSLCEQVARSEKEAKAWRAAFPYLLTSERILNRDLVARNRRAQAMDWFRIQSLPLKLVQTGFGQLGYQSLEDACEEADGYSLTREPTPSEAHYLLFMQKVVQELFDGYFLEFPPGRIIHTEKGVWRGMASCVKLSEAKKNDRGLWVRYRQNYVALKKHLLRKGRFPDALSTYLHELAHTFGGDCSASFSHAMTMMLEEALLGAGTIEERGRQWDQLNVEEESLPAP